MSLFPRSRGGLALLGNAAEGELNVQVRSGGPLLHAARDRSAKAVTLARRVQVFPVAQPAVTAVHLAWFLSSNCVAHALFYDARLVSSPARGVVAGPVSSKLEEIVKNAIAGKLLDQDAVQQM